MKTTLAVIVTVSVGCFSPEYGSGQLQCEPSTRACPPDYFCRDDNRCWKNGTDLAGTDVSVGDLARPDFALDLSVVDLAAVDLAAVDLGAVDQSGAADLSPSDGGAVVITQPFWTSCGGGAGTGSASGASLNLSIGGDAAGTSTAASGATVRFGAFSDDIY